jgi:hypothetical protein
MLSFKKSSRRVNNMSAKFEEPMMKAQGNATSQQPTAEFGKHFAVKVGKVFPKVKLWLSGDGVFQDRML